MLSLTPIAETPAPLQVRIMKALGAIDSMVAAAPQVDPDWLLTSVCKDFYLDREQIALMWLRRLLARDAARTALAAMDQADADG